MAAPFSIIAGGLDDPRVVALLDHHRRTAAAQTEPGSAHALDVSGLKAPEVRFFSAWGAGDALLAVGAWKRLSGAHGEVKSMHVAQAARGQGIGGAVLAHIVEDARAQGIARLSLETGAWDYFRPAHALYRRHGFAECGPFEGYREDRNSLFFTREIG